MFRNEIRFHKNTADFAARIKKLLKTQFEIVKILEAEDVKPEKINLAERKKKTSSIELTPSATSKEKNSAEDKKIPETPKTENVEPQKTRPEPGDDPEIINDANEEPEPSRQEPENDESVKVTSVDDLRPPVIQDGFNLIDRIIDEDEDESSEETNQNRDTDYE